MSDQITESQDTYEVTQAIVDSTIIDGVWMYTPESKSHAVVSRRDHKFSLCGIRMDERSSELPVPAFVTCRICLKFLPSALSEPVQPELPTVEDVLREDGMLPVIQATPEIPVMPVIQTTDDGLFRVTQVMLNEGLFIGVATIRFEGRAHAVVLNERHATGQATFCGVTVGSDHKGHVVTWQELPAVVDCGSCLPHARRLADFPPTPGDRVAGLLAKLKDVTESRDRLREELRELAGELKAANAALEEGVKTWRQKQRNMGGRIGWLEVEQSRLLHRIEMLQTLADTGTPEEVRAENEQLKLLVARWRGVAGVLGWKYGGPGVSVKTVSLLPMEWAAAYGELFAVDGAPVVDGDGRFEMTVSIRKPGDLGVPSENDGGREASRKD